MLFFHYIATLFVFLSFRTYIESTYPIIESFKAKGMVRHIIADRSVDEVYAESRQAYLAAITKA
jgi:adenylate kinase family enzyme